MAAGFISGGAFFFIARETSRGADYTQRIDRMAESGALAVIPKCQVANVVVRNLVVYI